MPIKSIAIFSPNSSPLYINVLLGLKKAFAKQGVVAHVGWSYLSEPLMAQFSSIYKPDAIIEIDRTRNKALGMPKDIVSIAWIQDWRSMEPHQIGYSSDNCGGSDLYYFCTKPKSLCIDETKLPHWDYLLQATDPELYHPEQLPFESDFSLMGYIPPLEHLYKLDTELEVEFEWPVPGEFGVLRDVITSLEGAGLTWNRYDAMKARKVINQHICERLTHRENFAFIPKERQDFIKKTFNELTHCVVPDRVLYLIENEIMRALARISVVEAALQASKSVRLFGVGMWQTYPRYLPYYVGPVWNEDDVRRIYITSRINLHNAMTQMHPRALDCMACGALIMVNKVLNNTSDAPDCLKAHFETGVQYLEYDEDDLAGLARELLRDERRIRTMGAEARKAICARHTWDHRAAQILSDLRRL